jgi:hypothetical protein
MIAFRCPWCGVLLQVQEQSAGRKVRCGGCRNIVDAPAPTGTALPAFAPAPPARAPSAPVRTSARGSGLWIGCLVGGLLAGVGGLAVLVLVVTGAVLLARGGAGDRAANPDPTPAPPSLFQRGPRVYLADLDEFGVRCGPWPYTHNGTVGDGNPIMVNGAASPKGLGMHPPDQDFSAARYHLHRQAAVFKTAAAINDTSPFCFNPAVFEVLGDDRQLWQSPPVGAPRAPPQECRVDVTGVDVLELRVHAQGLHWGLHAVWIEPRLLQKADTPDG